MKKITTFWNWFQKNEHEIIKAILLGINKEDVISQMLKKLDYVSKRIGFVIKPPRKFKDNFIIIFTGSGYPKLFAKIIALKNQAPTLKHFTVQAFIKPLEDITMYKEGTDEPCECKNFKIKISELQMALLDYNIATKQLKIDLYLPDYNELKQYNDLKSSIDYIVMQIIGEIAFHKHIKQIQLNQLVPETNGLLSLVELPDFIHYLYKINSRKKTRQI